MDDSQIHRLMTQSGCGGTLTPAVRRFAAACAAARASMWQGMRSAPKDGTAILVLLEGSTAPHAVRWLSGPEDPHATEETTGPGWHHTWDGSAVADHDGPRYWMHCPVDPDE